MRPINIIASLFCVATAVCIFVDCTPLPPSASNIGPVTHTSANVSEEFSELTPANALWLLEKQKLFIADLMASVAGQQARPPANDVHATALPPPLIIDSSFTSAANKSNSIETLAIDWMRDYEEKHTEFVKEYILSHDHPSQVTQHGVVAVKRRSNSTSAKAQPPIIHVSNDHRPEAPVDVYKTVKYHAAYSAAAYCYFGLSTWSCGARCEATKGNKMVKKLSSLLTDTNGFISVNEETESIIVTFRGTLSARNYLIDLVMTKVPFTAHGVPMEAQVNK
jgi:hypothetical protein